MILNLRAFEAFPAHVHMTGAGGSIQPEYEGLVEIQEISVDLNIQKSGEEFFCQGRVAGRAIAECARCLRQFPHTFDTPTDFIVCSQQWHESQKDAVDNEDYVYFSGAELTADITDILRQTVILSMAMVPLCREDCRGLCPQCGINRNDQSCQCRIEHIDSRWEALAKLKHGTDQSLKG